MDSTDFADVSGWHSDVARSRPILEAVIHHHPDSEEAKKARQVLGLLR